MLQYLDYLNHDPYHIEKEEVRCQECGREFSLEDSLVDGLCEECMEV
jgi:hypothetical protein